MCYDLGAAYFQQGSTNAAVYENAREKFFRTKELIAEVNTVITGTSYSVLKKSKYVFGFNFSDY